MNVSESLRSQPRLWVLVIVLAAVLMPAGRARCQTVVIPDPGLQRTLREALGKPTGEITVEEMERLTELNARAREIRSLEGLEAAKNLTRLDLANNRLANLSFPAGLTNLTTLDLTDNGLINLTLAGGLPTLTNLSLGGKLFGSSSQEHNHLTDFSFLTNLSSLTSLDLSANALTELSLPMSLTNLRRLNLGFNPLLTSFSFLAGLSRLSELSLHDNHLTQLTLPATLTNLATLDLSNNQLTSLALPEGWDNLRELNLGSGRFANPLTKLSLPAGNPFLWPTLLDLKNSSVQVTLLPSIKSPQRIENGDFTFTLFADAGIFTVLRSTDLQSWTEVGAITVTTPNFPGQTFTDTFARDQSKAFYRVK